MLSSPPRRAATLRSFSTGPSLSFCSTSVLRFSGSVLLPSRYVPTIGLAVAVGLHSFRVVFRSFPERRLPHGDPARSDDEKSPNRKLPEEADFQHGAPRQPPLQDYAAHAHPSFRPEEGSL